MRWFQLVHLVLVGLYLRKAFKDPQAGVKPPGVWKTLPGVISQVRTTNNLQRCKLISGLDIDRYVVEYRASEFFDTTLFNAMSITYSRIKPCCSLVVHGAGSGWWCKISLLLAALNGGGYGVLVVGGASVIGVFLKRI
ncbi:hypothetical protein POM88_037009 [Heracleum sosnowskyi]|uniref:Uncharacterized protein n=1 Tax=Heracleum sosnowskyi TaxID=360622 RepID=A0AAD8HRA6_9APIA|nr:hypothetical protein POM88_037009 [Heracleum sosnowskyi]